MVFRLWLLNQSWLRVEQFGKDHTGSLWSRTHTRSIWIPVLPALVLGPHKLSSTESFLPGVDGTPGSRNSSAGLTWEAGMTNGFTRVYVFTFFRALICMASVLSWATVSFSLSRSSCNVCLHCLSIFRSTSSCCLQKHQMIHWFARCTQISFCCSRARKTCFTHSCFSLFSICRCRLSALLAKSSLKRLVPSSAEVRRLSASCNLHHYNQGQTQDHR